MQPENSAASMFSTRRWVSQSQCEDSGGEPSQVVNFWEEEAETHIFCIHGQHPHGPVEGFAIPMTLGNGFPDMVVLMSAATQFTQDFLCFLQLMLDLHNEFFVL